jgi:hypothetical protein
MYWIRHVTTGGKGWLWLILFAGYAAHASQKKVVVDYSKQRPSILKSGKFFIQDVEDTRTRGGSTFGQILSGGRKVPVEFSGVLERQLFDYWSFAAPQSSSAYMPVYITVRSFTINEKNAELNKIKGTINLHITFRWYRNMHPVELTYYKTTAYYTREDKPFDYEKVSVKLLDQAIVFFDNWIISNSGKNPALVRNLLLVFKEYENEDDADTVFYHPLRPIRWSDFSTKSGRPGTRFFATIFRTLLTRVSHFPGGMI